MKDKWPTFVSNGKNLKGPIWKQYEEIFTRCGCDGTM